MLTTPLKFIHIGFGNMLCANKVTGIMPLGSAAAETPQGVAGSPQYLSNRGGYHEA